MAYIDQDLPTIVAGINLSPKLGIVNRNPFARLYTLPLKQAIEIRHVDHRAQKRNKFLSFSYLSVGSKAV